MERLVSPEFTQRVSDAPERSIPRSLWGQPSSSYKIESIEGRHHAARKLTGELAVVSLLLTQQPPLTVATEAAISMSWTSGRREVIAGR